MSDYPSSTRPDEWAQAFAVWLQRDDTVFDQDAMEDWFEAALKAGREATEVAFAPQSPAADADVVEVNCGGVWLTFPGADLLYVRPWATEIEALRWAVTNEGKAQFVTFGERLEP